MELDRLPRRRSSRGSAVVPSGPGDLSPHVEAPYDDASEQPPKDACGVFGVWAPGEDVAKLPYFVFYALQHRGQEAARMSVSDGTTVVVYKELGLVAQVFDEA